MYQEENRKQRFITMGEIMLRLTLLTVKNPDGRLL